MPKTTIYSNFGLIGDELELKTNVSIEIDKNGKIAKLFYDEIRGDITYSKHPNYILIPGLINSHIHICDSFAKELGFNKDLLEVVAPPDGLKHKLLGNTSKEIKTQGIKEAASEMLGNGITSFVDFTENGLAGINLLKKALENSPINYRILGRFRNSEDANSVLENADGLGFASYDQLSPKYKDNLYLLKQKNFGKTIACHDAELSRDEIMFNDIMDDKLIDVIIHGTQYTIEDLNRMKDNDISLVLCPRCNGYFGSGFPPINDINKLEIPISLGTDNVMANNIDLFEEMRYLYRISRVLIADINNSHISSKELLKMVSINAAKNMGLDKEYGSISEGLYADFSLLNLSDPNYYANKIDKENIYNIIVQRTKSENIKKTYIKGEVEFERK